MIRRSKLLALAALAPLVCAAVLSLTGGTAYACTCMPANPLDMVAGSDVVFLGSVVSYNDNSSDPVWDLQIDRVVKGEVGSRETVHGSEHLPGCGPYLDRFDQPIVVFTDDNDGRLELGACTPVPTADEFVDLVAGIGPTSGAGPPAAIMAGTYLASDLALLDGMGRTIGRTSIGVGYGRVAHCVGTTTAVHVTSGPDGMIGLIDLETLTITDRVPLATTNLPMFGARLVCIDNGATVISATGYGPEHPVVEITSMADPGGRSLVVQRSFDDVTRAIVHDTGTVFLLPMTVDAPLRTLDGRDLEPIAAGELSLPAGTSTLDADVSPDGSRLAILATVDGTPVEWDTGATHVLVVQLVDGLPTQQPVDVVELVDPGSTIFTPGRGAAMIIRWLDDDTWIIESQTATNNRIRVVTSAGEQLVDNVYAAWGRTYAAIPAGALRTAHGGVEIFTADGTTIDGDPAPVFGTGRGLWLAPLIDAPDFTYTPSTSDPNAAITITPVAAGTPSPRTSGLSMTTRVILAALGLAAVGAVSLMWKQRRYRLLYGE